ncbi:MAG: hypothetical protein WC623_22425 [Pedobacter sp.]|uniref:hypothetical protein n=1 Tax=Pedobacter sp. TaxID=1411316 RepID=UPI003563088B
MKTREEIIHLKQNWRNDPCWDIENTEGFEEYKEELLAYRLKVEAEDKFNEEKRVFLLCEKYHCNDELLKVIESMQRRIEALEQKSE